MSEIFVDEESSTGPRKDWYYGKDNNGAHIGYSYVEVDGSHVFVFVDPRGRFLESHVLRLIADKLDEMNKPCHDVVISKQGELINLLLGQITELTLITKVELGDDVIGKIQELKREINYHLLTRALGD